MKGLRNRDGAHVTGSLGQLHLHHRTSTFLSHASHTVTPAGALTTHDGDLIDTADDQAKEKGTAGARMAGRGVKNAGITIEKHGTQLVKGAVHDSSERVTRAAQVMVQAMRGGRTVSSSAMGTGAVKGGLIAATRRAAARRLASRATSGARAGARTVRTGAAATRQTVQTASMVGRVVAAALGTLSSIPGLAAAFIVAAITAVILSILSIIPGIAHEAETRRVDTVSIPAEYRAAVEQAGSLCPEITPNLVAAQIAQESGWNPDATSEVGARGISQFMPATWAEVGVDGDGDGIADVWNPQDAIVSQGHYMCSLVDQVKGALAAHTISGDVVSLALAAYNSGFGTVTDAGGIPALAETQNYVATILAAATGPSGDEGGVSANLAEAVEWAKTVAADDSYAYVWGGEGRADGGYDCSGLTQAVYLRLGIYLPHAASGQQMAGTGVDRANLKVGDLIFWGTPAYHVAIYAGDGWMVSADDYGSGINYEPIWGSPSSYRRIQ